VRFANVGDSEPQGAISNAFLNSHADNDEKGDQDVLKKSGEKWMCGGDACASIGMKRWVANSGGVIHHARR
jgi:hypothetical protein